MTVRQHHERPATPKAKKKRAVTIWDLYREKVKK